MINTEGSSYIFEASGEDIILVQFKFDQPDRFRSLIGTIIGGGLRVSTVNEVVEDVRRKE